MIPDEQVCQMCDRFGRHGQAKHWIGVLAMPVPVNIYKCPVCDSVPQRRP